MEGYAQTALLMHRNSETAIFRQFSTLSIKNLLYLQAELVELEYGLSQLAEQDKRSDHPNAQYYTRDWWYLRHSARDGDAAQWQKVLEIREKLKEYHVALEKHAFFLKLGGPSTYDLEILQDWMLKVPKFVGRDRSVWDDATDLIALSEAKYDDLFSKLIRKHLLPLYHRAFGLRLRRLFSKKSSKKASVEEIEIGSNPNPDPSSTGQPEPPQVPSTSTGDVYKGGFSKYSDARLIAAIEIVSTVISSMLPISSIIILYYVSSQRARLGIILGFTALFSLALATFTKARRVEIFAGTSAFAAVQVVFISSSGSPGCSAA
ncbi:hypothetical protein N431DRAFT_557033 [Stipitochalara longipes BDJ]|nr:hypothetical protein N431DRAFT_557033 [Stipitochalara longipes BDJ]